MGVPDVTIVGGGPAGSALAIALGRRGVRVALYEKARHPRLKPCGEGLLPHGVAALEGLVGLPDAPRLRGLRFAAGGVTVDADFPGMPGLTVRRDRFDAWLFELAASTPEVDARPATSYRGGAAGLVVGADGVRSRFHRRLPGRRPRRRRVGLSTHAVGIDGLTDRVEIFFHDGGELYLAPTGGGEALVSALFDHESFSRDGLTRLVQRIPGLRHRVARMSLTSPLLASAPLGLDVPRIVADDAHGRLLLVGDAAGTPDPIAAGGLALALGTTMAAADAVVTGDLARYQRRRLAMGRRAAAVAQVLLTLSRRERRAAGVLRTCGWLVPFLVRAAVRNDAPAARGRVSRVHGA